MSWVRLTALMCLAHVLSMTGFSTCPAVLGELRDAWGMTNFQAGVVSGMFFAGYMVSVLVLTTLTDVFDVRRVYAGSCALATLGALGFAFLAQGVWSAGIFQAMAGAGVAGTYMPGLKALAERLPGKGQSRAIAFYTSSFGVGASASLLLAGLLQAPIGWKGVFAVSALGPAAAGALVLWGLVPQAPHAHRQAASPGGIRTALTNRGAMSYVAGYVAHCWELFGLRAWLVVFLAFGMSGGGFTTPLTWEPASVAAAINLAAPVASILGNELATRLGRRRIVLAMIGVSGAVGCVTGFSALLSPLAVVAAVSVYFVLVMSDSSALTAGVVAAAPAHRRGAVMAVHSFFGFGAGLLAPLVFGSVLDWAGGGASNLAWGLAFASLGLPSLVGAGATALRERKRRRVARVRSRLGDLE
jgi:MFS family permease